MRSFEKQAKDFPRLKQYLELKQLAIQEALNARRSILNRRDYHLQSIQNELDSNEELLLFLGHVVDKSFESSVVYEETDEAVWLYGFRGLKIKSQHVAYFLCSIETPEKFQKNIFPWGASKSLWAISTTPNFGAYSY